MNDRLLITGGSSGIGKAIAERGVAAGWDVIVIDRLKAPIGRSIIGDLSEVDNTAMALKEALRNGPITRLVNNVGAVFPASIGEQSLTQLGASFDLNLRSAVQVTQALLPGMEANAFGRIVNVTSRAVLGKEHRSAYAAMKAGAGRTDQGLGPRTGAQGHHCKRDRPGAHRYRPLPQSEPGRITTYSRHHRGDSCGSHGATE